MNDIVIELRNVAAERDDATSNRLKDLCSRAADEIERLRNENDTLEIDLEAIGYDRRERT